MGSGESTIIPIGPGQTIVFNEQGKDAIFAFAKIAHYVLLIAPGEKKGRVVLPILDGAGVADELR